MNRFFNGHVYGIGLTTIDIILNTREHFNYQKNNLLDDLNISIGGTVGNVLKYLAYLGINAHYVGRIGNDLVGNLKEGMLRNAKVSVSEESICKENEKDIVCCFALPDGNRAFSSATNHSAIIDLENVGNKINKQDILILDGHYAPSILQFLKKISNMGNMPTIFVAAAKPEPDIWPVGILSLLPYADVLVCGDGFLQKATGCQLVSSAYSKLPKKGIVIQTQGEDGAIVLTKKYRYQQVAYKTKIIDTVGAGDAFIAGCVFGYIMGWEINKTTDFSAYLASYSCRYVGSNLTEELLVSQLWREWANQYEG